MCWLDVDLEQLLTVALKEFSDGEMTIALSSVTTDKDVSVNAFIPGSLGILLAIILSLLWRYVEIFLRALMFTTDLVMKNKREVYTLANLLHYDDYNFV